MIHCQLAMRHDAVVPVAGQVALARWDDGQRLVRLVTEAAFDTAIVHIGHGVRGRHARWTGHANDIHVVLMDEDRPAAAMQMALWTCPHHPPCVGVLWVGWAAPVLQDRERLRLVWWLMDEVRWGTGSLFMWRRIVMALGLRFGSDAFGPAAERQLDAAPEAWGIPRWDVEAWRLLDEPTPYVWALGAFLRFAALTPVGRD